MQHVHQKTPGPRRLVSHQRTIMEHLMLGETNAEIASDLGLTEHTVKQYLHLIYRKFGAKNRVHAVKMFDSGEMA